MATKKNPDIKIYSDPNNVLTADSNDAFYRDGETMFLISAATGEWSVIRVPLHLFLGKYDSPFYKGQPLVFSSSTELWVNGDGKRSKIGWKFISNKSISYSSIIIEPTMTPTPSVTPTVTPTSVVPTVTPTTTVTPTPTVTPTTTVTTSVTPTVTVTPSATTYAPFVYSNIPLVYSSSGDTNGLIYFVGTNTTSRSFLAPQADSSLPPNRGVKFNVNYYDGVTNITSSNDRTLIDRTTSSLVLSSGSNGVNSWVTMDLNRTLKVNKYTLRNSDTGSYAMRNWILQGSNNTSSAWTNLLTHTNDTTMVTSDYAYAAWNIPGITIYYQYFRIQMTGENAAGNFSLALSDVELYGDLISRDVEVIGTAGSYFMFNLFGNNLSVAGDAHAFNAVAWSPDNATWYQFPGYSTIDVGAGRPVYVRAQVFGSPVSPVSQFN